jgi:hypothetical protein
VYSDGDGDGERPRVRHDIYQHRGCHIRWQLLLLLLLYSLSYSHTRALLYALLTDADDRHQNAHAIVDQLYTVGTGGRRACW